VLGPSNQSFKLYTNKGSSGFVVEAALAKAGAPTELITIDYGQGEQNSPAYARINPMRQVPALVLPDGTLMTESAAIIIHLANLYPGSGLAPPVGTSAHAKFLRWMLFMVVNLYEADLRHVHTDRYTAVTDGVGAVKAAAAAHMARSFAVIETALDPWLTGGELSIADGYLAMLCTWSPVPLTSPKFKALRGAIAADPAYGSVWARHGFAA